MDKIKRLLENYVFPKGILDIRREFILNRNLNKLRFPENQNLKEIESTRKRCFILATGPSLKNIDLNFLQDEMCISVSNFFVHSDFQKIKPFYHVLAPSHPPITEESYRSFLDDCFMNMKHPVKIFMGDTDKKIIDQMEIPSNIDIFYYRSGGKFPIDASRLIPPMRTVIHPALYLSIYLGIKEIYLLGVDHSWINHFGVSQHFYEEEKNKLVQNNYNEWRHLDKGSLFKGYGLTWDVYRNIRDYYSPKGIKIYNLNPDSLLDIFPMKKIIDL